MIISDSIGFNVDRNVDEEINIDIDSETERLFWCWSWKKGDEEIELEVEGKVYSDNDISANKYVKHGVNEKIDDSVAWCFDITVGDKVDSNDYGRV